MVKTILEPLGHMWQYFREKLSLPRSKIKWYCGHALHQWGKQVFSRDNYSQLTSYGLFFLKVMVALKERCLHMGLGKGLMSNYKGFASQKSCMRHTSVQALCIHWACMIRGPSNIKRCVFMHVREYGWEHKICVHVCVCRCLRLGCVLYRAAETSGTSLLKKEGS